MNEDYELAIDHDKPYEITAFAKKHGLTTRAAELILFAYSPSRAACRNGFPHRRRRASQKTISALAPNTGATAGADQLATLACTTFASANLDDAEAAPIDGAAWILKTQVRLLDQSSTWRSASSLAIP